MKHSMASRWSGQWAIPLALLFTAAAPLSAQKNPSRIKLLFLGDNGHHRPAARFEQLQPVLAARGIDLTYSDHVDDLNPQTLAGYDGLIVYANIERIAPEQERALLDYVARGGGFIPIHCASACFLNSPKYVELVGAQFLRHGTGTFRTTIAEPDHPLMKGFRGFESWDETYVHHRHNEHDRVVLEYREDADGKEPWTWVRTHGRGRVFYTAWGHDERTWGHAGFQNLIERGIRWAVGADPSVVPPYGDRPEMTPKRADVRPFEYVEAEVPFYPASPRWGVTGEPIRRMQKPVEPEESIKHLITPVDLEPVLFASEPMISGKPICMSWDARGRPWIGVTVDYPNDKQPEGRGHDRILILEDIDGDGRADKATVFAEGLSLPTSLAFCRGGVIVHQPPQTLFLEDTDGDDVADRRSVLLDGWSTADTHAGPSNLRYGLDNWYYGMVGYAGFDGTVAGERMRFRQGFYRFQLAARDDDSVPTVARLEFLRNTSNNSWGVGFSEEGNLFGSTANGCPSVYLPIPNRYYESVRGWSSSVLESIAESNRFYPVTDKVRQVDFHGGFTAAAGHALYTARTYPREYWNRTAFVSDPTGHLTATFVLEADGAGFRARNAWNLLASDDEWTAPIMADVGPDGNVWVIDWYNYIVQHNPTPPGFKTGKGNAYATNLRDKSHGRIYRLVYKIAPRRDAVRLDPENPQQLVAALKQDNMLWRLHAQRLLVERGKQDVVPELIAMVGDQSVDEIGLNPGAIHALWALHGLGALDGSNADAIAAVVGALRHPSAGVRRNALQVLPRNNESLRAILACGVLQDANAQVRLAALLALAEMQPSQPAAEPVAAALEDRANSSDRWLLDAATSAAAAHDRYFLETVARSASDAWTGKTILERVEIVAEHYAKAAPSEAIVSLTRTLPASQQDVCEAIVAGLVRGWPGGKRPSLDDETEEALALVMEKLSPRGRGRLARLGTRWGSRTLEQYVVKVAATLLAQVRDEDQQDAERVAAATQLIELRSTDTETADELLALLSPRVSPNLADGLIEAVGRSEAAAVGTALLKRLGSVTPAVRAAAIPVLLGRADWTTALLDAAEQGTFDLRGLSLDQQRTLAAHPNRRIAARAQALLEREGGLPSPDRQQVLEELLPLAKESGDVAAGKAVFEKQCAKCHMHSGTGNRIGPDLTGMAVHTKEHLLGEIIDPSRNLEGNYRAYLVTTTEGRVLSGLLGSESRTALELFDAEGKKHTVAREDIDELVATPKSLMPEGFEKQISPEELVNLLEFLTARGRFLPLPLDKAATIVSTRGMFYRTDARAERLVFNDWSDKTFNGVPFHLIDPQGDRVPNVILLYGPQGTLPPKMPKSVTLPCNAPAKAIHLLSGVSGWGYPLGEEGSVSMIVRLHYADGQSEDHPLKNGEHFADYIRRVDVPGSQFAFNLRGRQIRYLSITPERPDPIQQIELVKGPDRTAPVVMAVTVETSD